MKWVILLVIIQIINVISQYVDSDIVIVDSIEIVSYSNPLTSAIGQTVIKPITFTTRQFLKIPKIILGFQNMDVDFDSISKSFEIYYENVTINGFDLVFTKYFDTKIYNIIAMYIAIESDDAYSKTISFSFSPWPTNNFIKISTPCQNVNSNQDVKVIAYITGLKSDGSKNVKLISIQTKAEISSQMTIDITVQQDDSTNKSLSEIKINYIEYYTSKTNTYYDLTVINDIQYIQYNQRFKNLYLSSQLLDLSRTSDIDGIGIALNIFNIPCYQTTARLEVTKQSYSILQKQLSYQYRIWENSSAYMFSATLAIFKMIDCSIQQPQNPINFSQQTKCVSSCPIGYSQKQNIGESFSYCIINPCTVSNCKLCDINGNCLVCQDSYIFYKQQCYSQQPAKTYCSQQIQECFKCKEGCLNCTDSTSNICLECTNSSCLNCSSQLQECTKCNSNDYLYNNNCINPKPDNTNCSVDKICTKCDDSLCQECQPELNICKTCFDGNYLLKGICYNKRPDNSYCGDDKKCFQCQNSNCQECDITQYVCTSCYSNNYLFNSECHSLQPDNTYCDETTKKCEKCTINQDCKICDSDLKSCQSCFTGKYLFEKNCFADIPDKTYCNNLKVCQQCTNLQCQNCDETLDKCTKCGKNEYSYNNLCYTQQPDNTYCNEMKVCDQCEDINCNQCNQVLNLCIKCENGYFLFQDKCYQQPPDNTYCDTNKICEQCKVSTACFSCNSTLNECSLCQPNQYLFEGLCFSEQPNSTNCSPSKVCNKCSNPNCLVCDTNLQTCQKCGFPKPYQFNGDCYEKIPEKSHCDESTFICQQCNGITCLNCENDLINCTSCQDNQYLYKKICEPSQPYNTYCDQKKICEVCNNNTCQTCDDTHNICLSCPNLEYLYNGSCVGTTQPPNTFCDGDRKCKQCKFSNCNKCNSNLEECLECNQNTYKLSSMCYEERPDNTQCMTDKNCVKCQNPICRNCDSDLTKCSVCQPSQYLYQQDCHVSQPDSTFCDQNKICQKCNSTLCKSCNSVLSNCESCFENNYLYNNQCHIKIPDNTYCNNNKVCEKCTNPDCQQCLQNKQECQSCSIDKYLYNNNCLAILPPNVYCDENKICSKCNSPDCLTCDQSKSKCISCSSKDFLYQERCQSEQPKNSYCDKQKCQQCINNNCLTCDSGLQNCISCDNTQFMFNNDCFSTQPKNTFCDDQSKMCQKCLNINCKVCEKDLQTCSECADDQYSYNKACISSQPDKSYCSPIKICVDCQNQSCKTCDGNLKDCLNCKDSDFMFKNQCYSTQPESTYCNQYNICQNCNPNCNQCKNNPIICQKCETGFYLFQGQCYDKQPPYTYCDELTLICKMCDLTCLSCSGPNDNNCISCDTNIFKLDLQTNKCICKNSGYVYQKSSDSCEKCKIVGCSNCQNDINKCTKCNDKMEYDAQTQECYCTNPLEYVSPQTQECYASAIPNCQKLKRNQYKCEQCLAGYQLDAESNRCQICNNGKYANQDNQCSLPCQTGCLKCINQETCLVKDPNPPPPKPSDDDDDGIFVPPEMRVPINQQECHYSCKSCFGINSNNCIDCSSQTREYAFKKATCNCKITYKEINQSECQQISETQSLMVSSSEVSFYSAFSMQLPMVFIACASHISYIIHLKQYVGLMSMNSNLSCQSIAGEGLCNFRNYNMNYKINLRLIKTDSEETASETNQIFISTCFLAFCFLVGFFSKITNCLFYGKSYLRWNLVLLMSRILNSYNIYLVIKMISQQGDLLRKSEISIIIFFSLFYILNQIFIVRGILIQKTIYMQEPKQKIVYLDEHQQSSPPKESENNKQPIQAQNRYLLQNKFLDILKYEDSDYEGIVIAKLHQNVSYDAITNGLNLSHVINYYFWIIVEIRKILVSCLLAIFSDDDWAYYLCIAISGLSIIFIIYYKPFENKKHNILAIISEVIVASLFLLYCLLQHQTDINSQTSQYITTSIIIITISFQVAFCLFMILSFTKFFYCSIKKCINKKKQKAFNQCLNNISGQLQTSQNLNNESRTKSKTIDVELSSVKWNINPSQRQRTHVRRFKN